MKINKALIGIGGTIACFVGLGIKTLADRIIFHEDGFNNHGYNHEGYHRNGFNKQGFDSKGYNANGYNMHGYDREGYDSLGYSHRCYGRYDRNGRNQLGFDKKGYDINGYNCNGYNTDGYNSSGIDCSEYNREYYAQKLNEMSKLFKSSRVQMNNGEFPYALHDMRIGIEKGVKCVIEHKKGCNSCNENLYQNIEICSRYALLDDDFIQKLHGAKNHCNDTQHDTDNYEKEHGQVFFTHKVLEEVMEIVKGYAS